MTKPPLRRDEDKQLVKEALKEWINERFAEFGKWTAKGLAVAAFGVFLYLYLTSQGWVHR